MLSGERSHECKEMQPAHRLTREQLNIYWFYLRQAMASSEKERAVLMFSGGPDSTTLLYSFKEQYDISGIVINHGQDFAEEEVKAAKGTAHRLNMPLEVVDISGLRSTLLGLPLSDGLGLMAGVGCGDFHPIIALAAVYGGLLRARKIFIAYHKGDIEDLPELPIFVEKFEDACQHLPATKGISFGLPFLSMTKAEVFQKGESLGVPFELTVSCISGKIDHCGECASCKKRSAAFVQSGVIDPTFYRSSPLC